MRLDRRLLHRTGNIRAYVAAAVTLGALAGAVTVAQAYFVSRVIDGAFLGGLGLDGLFPWLIALLAVLLVRAALNWCGEVAANRAAGRAKRNLREPLVAHLLRLGPRYVRGERSGELTNVATEGVEALDAYFSQYLPQLFLVAVVPLIIGAAVFWADVLSGTILLLTAPLLPIFIALIGLIADSLTKKQWRTMSQLSAHYLDVMQGLTTLKLFGRTQAQRQTIGRISDRFRDVTLGVLRVAFLSSLVLEVAATISTAVLAVEIGLRLLYGQMAFGPALFVLLLAPEFYMPFRALGARFHAAMSGGEAASRLLDILEVPEPSRQEHPVPVPRLNLCAVRFEDVCYTYGLDDDPGQRPALRGVSFTIEPGQRVALVGPSGAGKSTVAQLLLRFIEPSGGEITVDNTPLASFSPEEWRKQIAWVPQRPYLFNATVAENIGLGRDGASREEIVEAAKAAHAHEFIQALPLGYDTVIGERGARLSGGQAQRLGLARAFLKSAPLLILDEATSNLDPENESLIVEATGRLMEGRTVVTIAHRLGTTASADRVIVLEEGRVGDEGTHRALLARAGTYRRLVGAYRGAEA